MSTPDRAPAASSEVTPQMTPADDLTLAEDLLLLLFQPDSGTIAGEGTLYYVLAGAVLADLGLGGQVQTGIGRMGGVTVQAVTAARPADPLLLATWEYVEDRERGVQTVLAATGPTLRDAVLDRLVERGELHRRTRKTLGFFQTSVLEEGDSGRRARLLAEVRAVLVDGAEPSARLAALTALLYGSGTLPQFDRDIPWTSPVIVRAEELKNGNWGANAAAKAVARTVTATIVSIAAVVAPRG